MTRPKSRARLVLNGLVLVALLAVAGVVLHTTPDAATQQAPIRVAGVVGTEASGRNIRVTVHSVAAAESVTAGTGWAGTTPGVWVVAQVSVEAVVEQDVLGTAVLRVGGDAFSASVRPQEATFAGSRLAVGIPHSGPLLFEVPATALDGGAAAAATLEFANSDDPRVDSLIVVPVDLSTVEVESSLDVDSPVWGER